MDGTGSGLDPRTALQEATQQIREAVRALREGVVQAVMRRNTIADQLTKMDAQIADLETKAALADRINNPSLAAELRQERQSRQVEREILQKALASAEASAEEAKTRLPEEEARLTQQAHAIKARFAEAVGNVIDASGSGRFGAEADSMFARATEKLRTMEREVAARQEVAGGNTGNAPSVSPEQNAEQMLAALESRLGLQNSTVAPAPPRAEVPPAPPAIATPVSIAPTPPAAVTPVMSPATEARETTSTTLRTAIEPTAAPTEAKSFSVALGFKGEKARMEPKDRIRVAGIGTGGIFRGAHLPAYPEIPQVQLVALCDPDKKAQDLAYKRYQSLVEAKIKQANEREDLATVERLERDLETVQICDDISEVIETVKPDLVDICTQPFLHAPLSIQALEAGIHVMCEKPISRSWLETKRLIETAQHTGKIYQHNENWLWDPDYYTAKKLVDAGAIGEPILMYLATAHGGPEGNGKFWNSGFGGGGALLDNGIHAIGASWYISGLERRPALVKAAEPFGMSIRMPQRIIDGRYQQVQVDDDAHILIRFEDPASGAWTTAHVEGSWSHRDSPDTAIIGTTGKIVFKNEDNHTYAVVYDAYEREARRIQTSGPTWQHWPSSFYGEILNMVECVRHGVPSISTPQFGADCSAIVGASYLSQKGGKRAVTLDEFKSFANDIAARYPNDPKGADDALVEALLSAVRK